MLRPPSSSLLRTATIGLSLIWVAIWIVDLCLHPSTLPSQYMLLGAGFIGLATLGMACQGTMTRDERQIARFLDVLSRLSPDDATYDAAALPSLPKTNALHETAERFRTTYAEWAARL